MNIKKRFPESREVIDKNPLKWLVTFIVSDIYENSFETIKVHLLLQKFIEELCIDNWTSVFSLTFLSNTDDDVLGSFGKLYQLP